VNAAVLICLEFVCLCNYTTTGNLIVPGPPTQGGNNTLGSTIAAVVSAVVAVLLIAAAWWKRQAVRTRYHNIKQRIQRQQKRQQHPIKPSQQAAAVEPDCESPQAGGALNSSSEALTSRAPHATAATATAATAVTGTATGVDHKDAADIPLLLPPDDKIPSQAVVVPVDNKNTVNELVLAADVSLQPLDSVTGSNLETTKPLFRENAIAVTGAIVNVAVQHAPIVNAAWGSIGAVAGNILAILCIVAFPIVVLLLVLL
jgi:hypothetical protein